VSVESECGQTEKLHAKARALHEVAATRAVDESSAPFALGIVALAAAVMMPITTWSGHF
jgi:hypothetical protein